MRIMDAARRLFAAEGYHSVSMRRIADAIEYSPTAIYLHFKDKQSLIRELCSEDFGKLAESMVHLAGERDPIERIRKTGHLYIRFAVEHPNHYRLMFMTPIDDPELSAKDPQAGSTPDAYAFLLHSVEEALSARRFAPKLKDPRLLTQTFWAAVHGVASLEIAMGKDPCIDWADLDARASAAIEATIRGMDRPRWALGSRDKKKAARS